MPKIAVHKGAKLRRTRKHRGQCGLCDTQHVLVGTAKPIQSPVYPGRDEVPVCDRCMAEIEEALK